MFFFEKYRTNLDCQMVEAQVILLWSNCCDTEEGDKGYAGRFAIVVVPLSIFLCLCQWTELLKIRLKKLMKCEHTCYYYC